MKFLASSKQICHLRSSFQLRSARARDLGPMSALGATRVFNTGSVGRVGRGTRGVSPRGMVHHATSQIGVVTCRRQHSSGRVWRLAWNRGGACNAPNATSTSSPDPNECAENTPETPKPPPFEIPAPPPQKLRVPVIEAIDVPDDDDLDLSSEEHKNGFFAKLGQKNKPAPPTGVRARDVVTETCRMTFRDFGSTVVLALVAGAAAQVLNLGGTFLLAIFGVHEVELVAAVFLIAVQLAKQVAQISVRVATFRNARDVDVGDVDGVTCNSRMNPKNAWQTITSAFSVWKFILFIDARRLLSIAWNGVLTIPIPYLGLVKLLDYVLCVPVFLFEGLYGKECLQRSEALMLGHRLRFLRAGLGLGGILSMTVGVVVGIFSVVVPSLPTLLMEPANAASQAAGITDGVRASDAAMGLFTGTAFDKIWDCGTLTEKWATVVLLFFAVVGSFLFAAAVRQLVYVFYRETASRWTPPPPPPEVVDDGEPGAIQKFIKKMAFWKKVEEGDVSQAIAERTKELAENERSGDGDLRDDEKSNKEK